MQLQGRRIADGSPCFIIAEAGVNHNGQADLALDLVQAAHEAGADAIKFQSFRAENVVAPSAPRATYQRTATDDDGSQLSLIQALELSPDLESRLARRCRELGLLFLSTPFDRESLHRLAALGMETIKIPSGELTNTPFLKEIGGLGMPVILSTGMCTLGEVRTALDTLRAEGSTDLAVLQCVSAYPAPPGACNLQAMTTMAEAFGVPVGFSDHTQGIHIALAAVARGATILEKHITLDRALPGPDHAASIEPSELARMVRFIREIESAIGTGQKTPDPCERETAAVARRSLILKKDLPAGSILTQDMIEILRPGTGLAPDRLASVLGRTMAVSASAGTPLTEELLA